MDMNLTLVLFGISAGMFALASWRAARPTTFGKVRYVPWTMIALATGVAALFFLVHVVNLLGVTTGPPATRGPAR